MSKERRDRRQLSRIAADLGVELDPDWTGVDAVLPLLQRMRADGAVVLVKLDGGRGPGDNGPYTVLASEGPLGQEFVRIDAHSLEAALAHVICGYASKCWPPAPIA